VNFKCCAAACVRRGLAVTCVLLSAAASSNAGQNIPGVDIIIKKTPGGKATIFEAPNLPAGDVYQLNDVEFPIPLATINTTRSNTKGGMSIFVGELPDDLGNGNWQLDSFFDVTYSVELEGPGVGGGPVPFVANGMVHVSGSGVTIADRDGDGDADLDDELLNVTEGPIHQFDVSVESLSLSHPSGILLRESPTLASTAQILRRDLPDGRFQIASFFDVFVEMSADGGGTWTAGSSSMQFMTAVPEPGSLALLSAGAVLVGGRWARRRVRRLRTKQ
jgi:hypothetical protein